jgi:multiple sugar transport system ATP-binding protein
MRERAELAPGQTIQISLKTPNLHFFDKTSQQRL